MGRFRNPRYAPEWLEPRLSPSGLYYSPVIAAEVGSTSSDKEKEEEDPEAPLPRDSEGYPIPNPAPLPVPGPGQPG